MLRDRQPQESVEGSSQSEAVGGGGECGHSGTWEDKLGTWVGYIHEHIIETETEKLELLRQHH